MEHIAETFYAFAVPIGFVMSLKMLVVVRVMAFYSPLNTSKGRFISALRGLDYS